MNDLTISSIHAREVLDCRGLPTVQVDLAVGGGAVVVRADVPSGRSTGSNEAHELRDGGARFGGFGVLSAVSNVNDVIAPALVGTSVASQRLLDAALWSSMARPTSRSSVPMRFLVSRWQPRGQRLRLTGVRSIDTSVPTLTFCPCRW